MKKVMENVKTKFAAMKAVAQNRLACRDFATELSDDNAGMGTIEIVLIIVGICIADKSRILCGNFRCI